GCVALRTHITFIPQKPKKSHEIRISLMQSCWTDRLMYINHDFMFGSNPDSSFIMIDHPLTIVMLTSWNDTPYITSFHSRITVCIHELKCSIKLYIIRSGIR